MDLIKFVESNKFDNVCSKVFVWSNFYKLVRLLIYKIKKIKLQMNERKIFLQQALVLVRLHLLYFVYRPSEVQITRQNIQELSSNNFLKKLFLLL